MKGGFQVECWWNGCGMREDKVWLGGVLGFVSANAGEGEFGVGGTNGWGRDWTGRVQLVWWGGLTRGALVDCPRLWCFGKECIELTFAPSSLSLSHPRRNHATGTSNNR